MQPSLGDALYAVSVFTFGHGPSGGVGAPLGPPVNPDFARVFARQHREYADRGFGLEDAPRSALGALLLLSLAALPCPPAGVEQWLEVVLEGFERRARRALRSTPSLVEQVLRAMVQDLAAWRHTRCPRSKDRALALLVQLRQSGRRLPTGPQTRFLAWLEATPVECFVAAQSAWRFLANTLEHIRRVPPPGRRDRFRRRHVTVGIAAGDGLLGRLPGPAAKEAAAGPATIDRLLACAGRGLADWYAPRRPEALLALACDCFGPEPVAHWAVWKTREALRPRTSGPRNGAADKAVDDLLRCLGDHCDPDFAGPVRPAVPPAWCSTWRDGANGCHALIRRLAVAARRRGAPLELPPEALLGLSLAWHVAHRPAGRRQRRLDLAAVLRLTPANLRQVVSRRLAAEEKVLLGRCHLLAAKVLDAALPPGGKFRGGPVATAWRRFIKAIKAIRDMGDTYDGDQVRTMETRWLALEAVMTTSEGPLDRSLLRAARRATYALVAWQVGFCRPGHHRGLSRLIRLRVATNDPRWLEELLEP